jgi:competence ComEA-like helix-hairpin-helix protein
MTGRINWLAMICWGCLVLAVPAFAAGKAPAEPVALNTATVEELCTLPGIGPKKAEAIVRLRSQHRFVRVTQLLQVKGIGRKTLEKLKPHLVLDATGQKVAPAPPAQ